MYVYINRSVVLTALMIFCIGTCYGADHKEWADEESDAEFDASEWQILEEEEGEFDTLEGFEEIDATDGIIDLSASEGDQDLQAAGAFHRLDLYYISIGYTWALREDSSVQILDGDEWDVYQKLIKQSLLPSYFSLEASVYPMPILGVVIKKEWPDTYKDAQFTDDFNLVESVTSGFDEPYSVSLLFNNVSAYKPENADAGSAPNVGFMGYLLSVGDQHIIQNELVQDLWYELEWKVKGSFENGPESFNWGLQVGVKNHQNSHITDTLYCAVDRHKILKGGRFWSFAENTGYSASYSLSRSGLEPVEANVFITKYFPVSVSDSDLTPAIAIGLIYQSERKYSNAYQNEYGDVNKYILAIRPTLSF